MPLISDRIKDQIAWALLFICPGFFASNMLMARGMSGVFPPISMAFTRWLFVGIFVFLVLAIMRRIPLATIKAEAKQILFLASLGMGLCGGPVYLAGELTTATNIGLIYSAAPLLIALIAFVVFRERLNKWQALGLIMGLVGVLTILIKADFSRLAGLTFNGGDLWIVLATTSFAIYSLGLKYMPTTLTRFQQFGAMAFGGALWHAPFTLWEIAVRGPLPEITISIIGAFMVLVFLSSIGAYLTYGFIVTRLGATIAGATLYLSPVYAAVLAVILLDERIMAYHLIGGALILPGLWLVSRRPKAA